MGERKILECTATGDGHPYPGGDVRKRERSMTDPRQRTRTASPPGGAAMAGERESVLARRRLALIALVAAVPITLGVAIFTGSTMFLIINLVFDLLIAGYVAMLLQIKQGQDSRGGSGARTQRPVQDARVRR